MLKQAVPAAFGFYLLATAGPVSAAESEQDVDNLVFIGRLVSIEELPNPCGADKNCIMMDALWRARYQIVQPIAGTYPKQEITFDVADHYGFPPMARFRHALLFVGLYSDGPWLHKYQGFAVHPLKTGGWGFCGDAKRTDRVSPRPEMLPFVRNLEVVDAGDPDEIREVLDPEFFSFDRGQVNCKSGIALPVFYEVVRTGALQARGVVLPPWTATHSRSLRSSGKGP